MTDPANMQLPDLPDDLTNILRPYQKTGVAFLWNMLRAGFGVCMADDMGLGKTLQVITALELFRRNGELANLPALAVVPASLLQNWMDECQRFAPGLKVGNLHPGALSEEEKAALEQDPEKYLRRFDLVLVTYALVSRRTYLTDRTFPLILLDEAQQIKNPSSGVSRAVRSLRGGTADRHYRHAGGKFPFRSLEYIRLHLPCPAGDARRVPGICPAHG